MTTNFADIPREFIRIWSEMVDFYEGARSVHTGHSPQNSEYAGRSIEYGNLFLSSGACEVDISMNFGIYLSVSM
jgi:hypothetical protein